MQGLLLIITVIASLVALATGFFTPLAIAIQTALWALSLEAVDTNSKI